MKQTPWHWNKGAVSEIDIACHSVIQKHRQQATDFHKVVSEYTTKECSKIIHSYLQPDCNIAKVLKLLTKHISKHNLSMRACFHCSKTWKLACQGKNCQHILEETKAYADIGRNRSDTTSKAIVKLTVNDTIRIEYLTSSKNSKLKKLQHWKAEYDIWTKDLEVTPYKVGARLSSNCNYCGVSCLKWEWSVVEYLWKRQSENQHLQWCPLNVTQEATEQRRHTFPKLKKFRRKNDS